MRYACCTRLHDSAKTGTAEECNSKWRREEAELGKERSAELGRLTDRFLLRRTKALNAAYLPPLASYVVFCRPSALQVRASQPVPLCTVSHTHSFLRPLLILAPIGSMQTWA